MNEHGINEGIIPIRGGWCYEQDFNESLYRIPEEGAFDTFQQTVDAVMVFRINQGIDLGDPGHDVANYIKEKSPQNDIHKLGPIMRSRPITSLLQHIRDWLDRKLSKRAALVGNHEATERAAICRGCIQNVQWKIKTCSDCNAAIEHKGACVRRMTTFPPGDDLKACRCHRMLLPAAIFLDRAELPDRSPEAPATCWVKNVKP